MFSIKVERIEVEVGPALDELLVIAASVLLLIYWAT